MPHVQRKAEPPAAKPKWPPLGALRFQVDGSCVSLQHHVQPGETPRDRQGEVAEAGATPAGAAGGPAAGAGAAAPKPGPPVLTMRVDLKTGRVWVGNAARLPDETTLVFGVMGLLRLEHGAVLPLITKAKKICSLVDGPVWKVEETHLAAHESINACANDVRHAALLQEALNPKAYGCHLYFSHAANLTSRAQRRADLEAGRVAPLNGPWPAYTTAVGSTAAAGTTAKGGRSAARGGAKRPMGHGAMNQSSEGGGQGLPRLGAWWTTDGGDGDDGGKGGGGERPMGPQGRGGGGGGSGSSSGSGGGSLWSRADPRFTWNAELMRPLLEAGAEAFALPLMAGFVGQAAGATFAMRLPRTVKAPAATTQPQPPAAVDSSASAARADDGEDAGEGAGGDGGDGEGGGVGCTGELTLVSRLGAGRPVAGGWRRGLDRQGHAAGFTETELILSIWAPQRLGPQQQREEQQQQGEQGAGAGSGSKGSSGQGSGTEMPPQRRRVALASYVMLRGSAPLLWAAPPDMRPCPPPRGPPDSASGTASAGGGAASGGGDGLAVHAAAFAAHVSSLLEEYGKPLLLLNLIHGANQRPQLRLHDTLAKLVDTYNAQLRGTTAPPSDAARSVSTTGGEQGTAQATASEDAAPDDTVPRPPRAADAADAASPDGPGRGGGGGRTLTLVGFPLGGGGALADLAGCGGGAARLEAAAWPELGNLGAFVAVEELIPGPGGEGAVVVTARRVLCRQGGAVRVSSGSTASAGGCCEEVDLAQHALALPSIAALLASLGALDDPGEVLTAHAAVVQALATLWAHQAHVLSDAAHGTPAAAGRLLEGVAVVMGGGAGGAARRLGGAMLRAAWRRLAGAGDRMSRYYYANFADARRQDAADLAAGVHKVSSPPRELPRRQPPNTSGLQLGLMLLAVAVIQVFLYIAGRFPVALSMPELALRTLGPAALGGVLLAEVGRRGAAGRYVEQPVLAPELTWPWTAGEGTK